MATHFSLTFDSQYRLKELRLYAALPSTWRQKSAQLQETTATNVTGGHLIVSSLKC